MKKIEYHAFASDLPRVLDDLNRTGKTVAILREDVPVAFLSVVDSYGLEQLQAGDLGLDPDEALEALAVGGGPKGNRESLVAMLRDLPEAALPGARHHLVGLAGLWKKTDVATSRGADP